MSGVPKKYGVIIADPPWTYSNSGVRGAAVDIYNVMTTDDICDLPISDLSSQDCTLLLWATWPCLTDAFRVISALGFEFVTGMPWVKCSSASIDLWGELQATPSYGTGFWLRGCSEPILICRRGHPQLPKGDWLGLLSERWEHSRKPDNLYEYAESMPGPYLEMFARRKRDGWDVWGNEVESDLVIT